MSHIVELPNGGTAEFPDEMSEQDISSILQKQFKPELTQEQDIPLIPKLKRAGSILGQDISKLPLGLVNLIGRGLNAAPTEIPGLYNQLYTNPGRAAQNLAYGAGELQKAGANIATGATWADFMAHLGMIPEERAKNYPLRQKQNVIADLMGIPEETTQPGDVLLREIHNAMIIPEAPVTALSKIPKSIIGKKNPAAIAKVSQLENQLSNVENKLPELAERQLKELENKGASEAELQKAEENLKKAQSEARTNINVGSKETPTIELNINKANKELEDIVKTNEDLSNKLTAIKSTEPINFEDMSHTEAIEKTGENVANAARDIETHEAHQKNVEELAIQKDKELKKYLNEGADYPVRVQREMKYQIESMNNYWKNEFKFIKDKVKENNTILNNPQRLPEINRVSEELKSTYGEDPHGEFASLIKKAPTAKDTKASDYMAKQMDWRDARYNILKRAIDESKNGSKVKADELFKVYNDSKPIDKIISDVLEEGLGEFSQKYKEVNEGYSKQVHSLDDNKLAHKIMGGEPLTGDIAREFSGYQPGQELLRGMALKTPEIRRNILGQQYVNKPHEIANAGELHREYLNLEPELEQKAHVRSVLESERTKAKENIEQAKERHERTKSEYKEAKDFAKQRQKEINTLKKENKDKISSEEKLKKKLQDEIKDLNEKKNEIEDKIPHMKKHLEELSKLEKIKKISLEKHQSYKKAHDKAEREYNFKIKERDRINNDIKRHEDKVYETTTGLRKLYLVGKTLYKAAKKLKGI